jgi:tRNA threonylcarbamoyladenosine modification (KEOPS) complex  Pcc1 subunit
LKRTKAEIVLKLDSKKAAAAVYNAVLLETKQSIGPRSTAHVRLKERQLQICLNAMDLNALRAALNSYLRWVAGSADLITTIDLLRQE